MIKNIQCQGLKEETVLKVYRDALGLSQEQLANHIGIHRRTVIRCEKGEKEIMLTTVQFQRFCRLIYDKLGLGALLHFTVCRPIGLSSFDTCEVKQLLEQEKDRLALDK